IQILIIAGFGIVAGLIVAALMPYAATALLSGIIPVEGTAGIYPGALALAMLFGLLVTLVFALIPLGRAQDVPATALFRELGLDAKGLPRTFYVVLAAGLAVLLALLAILTSGETRIAAIFVGAAVVA